MRFRRFATPSPQIPIAAPIKGGPLQIDAVAQQWVWRFFYPGGPTGSGARTSYDPNASVAPGNRTFTVNELVVPVDTPVVLNITSTDVLHRWFVPTLGGQVDAVPGQVSHTWFRADETGILPGPVDRLLGRRLPGRPHVGQGRHGQRVPGLPAASRRRDLAGAAEPTSSTPRTPATSREAPSDPADVAARPEIVSEGLRRRRPGLGRARDQHRPQDRLDALPRRGALVPRAGGARARPDADPAHRRPRTPRSSPRRSTASSRRSGRRRSSSSRSRSRSPSSATSSRCSSARASVAFPRARPALGLALPRRRRDDLRKLPLPAELGRHAGAAAALDDHLLADARGRRLDRRRRAGGPRLRAVRGQHARDVPQHAGARAWSGGGRRSSRGRARRSAGSCSSPARRWLPRS